MRFLSPRILIFIAGFTITAVIFGFISYKRSHQTSVFFTQGFDFYGIKDETLDHPKIGENIQLINLSDIQGNYFQKSNDRRLILLAVLDPKCMACAVSGDLIENIRKYCDRFQIDYRAMVLVPIDKTVDQRKYAKNFGFQDLYHWNEDKDLPSSLAQLVTPNHILVDNMGTVIHVWPGTNNSENVRKVMGDQIGSDLNLIIDTLNAAESVSNLCGNLKTFSAFFKSYNAFSV